MLRTINEKALEDTREKIYVDHPDYGHVVFSNLTPRQKDVIEKYKSLVDNTDKSEG